MPGLNLSGSYRLFDTVTVSAGYGSGMITPGTGFWLNNSLGEVELHPEGFHGVPTGTRLQHQAPLRRIGRTGRSQKIRPFTDGNKIGLKSSCLMLGLQKLH